ncbi:MAG: hypothetical protein HWN68_13785 [Desulfobacterales bacterium]|nr:hypothetical protein [Desulfobacterales bacterium]
MRIGDIVYFSPNRKLIDLKWDDKDNLVAAFADRVEGFYLTPARQLNDAKQAFATGVICVTTIDFLAKIQTGEEVVWKRNKQWLEDNLPAFAEPDPQNPSKRTLAKRFYEEFRNGLVHEGRIKNAGQFSYDYPGLVEIRGPVMIVNPGILLAGISESFIRYMKNVSSDEFTFQSFRCALTSCFQADMEIVRK